jgi:hypothetical protein
MIDLLVDVSVIWQLHSSLELERNVRPIFMSDTMRLFFGGGGVLEIKLLAFVTKVTVVDGGAWSASNSWTGPRASVDGNNPKKFSI